MPNNPNATQRGFSLAEVLVTLLLFSIGLLAVAALHLKALAHHHGSYLHTQAMLSAGDMAERIRLNHEGALHYIGFDSQTQQPAAQDCYNNACSAQELAAHDLAYWHQTLNSTDTAVLPGARALIKSEAGALLLTLMWQAPKQGVSSCVPDQPPHSDCLQLRLYTPG